MATVKKPDELYRGDTWVKQWQLKIATVPIDLTGASARLYIRDKKKALVCEATTANAKITITELTGTVSANVPAAETELFKIEDHKYDLEITHADGTVKTYVSNTLKILEDQTYD